MSNARWTERHRCEAQRRLYQLAALIVGEGPDSEFDSRAAAADRMVSDVHMSVGSERSVRVFLGRFGLDRFGVDEGRIEREIRRIRALAEGRLVREAWHEARRGDTTLPVPHVPPGGDISESDFMEQLRRALNAPGRSTRVWRQNAGGVTTRDRAGKVTGRFLGAVVGAADLSGLVRPSGRRLEIEVKVDHEWTDEQKSFASLVQGMGGIYVLVRYDHDLALAENVSVALEGIDDEIACG